MDKNSYYQEMAIMWIEKTFNIKLEDLQKLRDQMKVSGSDFMAPNFVSVANKAMEAKDIDELQTSIERCYKRDVDINLLTNLFKSGDMGKDNPKDYQKIYIMRWVFNTLLYKVFLPEMLYAMQYKKLRKDANFNEPLDKVYEYWTYMCEIYLSKTEVYELMLEDWNKSQENNNNSK